MSNLPLMSISTKLCNTDRPPIYFLGPKILRRTKYGIQNQFQFAYTVEKLRSVHIIDKKKKILINIYTYIVVSDLLLTYIITLWKQFFIKNLIALKL